MQVRTIERNIKSTNLNLKFGSVVILKYKYLKLQELIIRFPGTAETETESKLEIFLSLLKDRETLIPYVPHFILQCFFPE